MSKEPRDDTGVFWVVLALVATGCAIGIHIGNHLGPALAMLAEQSVCR